MRTPVGVFGLGSFAWDLLLTISGWGLWLGIFALDLWLTKAQGATKGKSSAPIFLQSISHAWVKCQYYRRGVVKYSTVHFLQSTWSINMNVSLPSTFGAWEALFRI